MIALVAAAPLETEQLRQKLVASGTSGASLPLWRGPLEGREVVLAHCGIGKASAAAAVTELLLTEHPDALLVFGCGGAYPGSGLANGDLALATGETFADEGVLAPEGFLDLSSIDLPMTEAAGRPLFNHIPLDSILSKELFPTLEAEARRMGHRAAQGPFATVSTCSGTDASGADIARRTGALCENMEGAAVALACARREVPCVEVRSISNLVEDRDRSRWELRLASENAQQAVLALLASWPQKDPRP